MQYREYCPQTLRLLHPDSPRANFRRWARFWGLFLVSRTLKARKGLLKRVSSPTIPLETVFDTGKNTYQFWSQCGIRRGTRLSGKRASHNWETTSCSQGEFGRAEGNLKTTPKTTSQSENFARMTEHLQLHCTVHNRKLSDVLQVLKGFGLSTLPTVWTHTFFRSLSLPKQAPQLKTCSTPHRRSGMFSELSWVLFHTPCFPKSVQYSSRRMSGFRSPFRASRVLETKNKPEKRAQRRKFAPGESGEVTEASGDSILDIAYR